MHVRFARVRFSLVRWYHITLLSVNCTEFFPQEKHNANKMFAQTLIYLNKMLDVCQVVKHIVQYEQAEYSGAGSGGTVLG